MSTTIFRSSGRETEPIRFYRTVLLAALILFSTAVGLLYFTVDRVIAIVVAVAAAVFTALNFFVKKK